MIRFNHFNFNVVDLDRSLTFYRDALGQGRSLPDVGQQRLLIGVHPVLPPRQGVEVAVVALAPAEGDMDVNAQLVRLSGLSLSHGAALLMISKVL